MFQHIFRPLTVMAILVFSTYSTEPSWLSVSTNPDLSISGMALLSESEEKVAFVVVHDTKKDPTPCGPYLQQPKVGIVTVTNGNSLTYTELKWPSPKKDQPIPADLEAIASVPKEVRTKNREFVALSAQGRLFHFVIDEQQQLVEVQSDALVVSDTVQEDLEGMDLFYFNKTLYVIWAERGKGKEAGIFSRQLDLKSHKWLGDPIKSPMSVPLPEGLETTTIPAFRGISDVKLNSFGDVFVSSAYDPGKNGPFFSVVRRIGRFQDGKIELGGPQNHRKYADQKIEAIEFVPSLKGALALGTDNENQGGTFSLDWKVESKTP